ncbi:hypothetical protein OSB04_020497 [Centaurea solstitialis]|uniref:Uncharacterized protein n=1 Tax=Centaurea solstitialis TaxID=347529 RepID=A0AA38WFA6_9ASTR|nr:hypothetical protein OSB04_020497 [Centaurea solstitialis]
MSTSSEIVDSGRFSGQNRSPEKSNFSQTCNLFSQYLKENSFPDLTLVIVFNDLSQEKVKEIMKLAENGVPQKSTTAVVSPAASVSTTPKADETPAKTDGVHLLHPVVAPGSDLPIARKASLARFLEKRKDRITARSPYQIEGGSKQEDTKSWLGLGAQSEVQFQP